MNFNRNTLIINTHTPHTPNHTHTHTHTHTQHTHTTHTHIQGLLKRFERFKFGILVFYVLIVKIRYNFTHK